MNDFIRLLQEDVGYCLDIIQERLEELIDDSDPAAKLCAISFARFTFLNWKVKHSDVSTDKLIDHAIDSGLNYFNKISNAH